MDATGTRVPSLEGRSFSGVSNSGDGEVSARTVFRYHERDGLVWADYEGGEIALGRLVGTRTSDRLDFRYVHVAVDGTTSSGHCTAELEILTDGRIRSRESWQWESRPGSGHSIVDEVAAH